MPKRQLQGRVASNKMTKTLAVEVERLKEHKKYKKRYKVKKKYKVHYDEGEYQVGDLVLIEETKPISREKRWRVKQKS